MRQTILMLVAAICLVGCTSSGGIPGPTPEEMLDSFLYLALQTDLLLKLAIASTLLLGVGMMLAAMGRESKS